MMNLSGGKIKSIIFQIFTLINHVNIQGENVEYNHGMRNISSIFKVNPVDCPVTETGIG